MKTAICYYSRHHGNTLKVLEAMADEGDVDLIDVTTRQTVRLEEYDCIDKDGKPAYVMKGHTDRYILVKQETTREVCEQSVNTFVDILYRPEKSK